MAAPFRFWAVVPAAGRSQRMGKELPKQYLSLAGRTVLEWALTPILARQECQRIVVTVAWGDRRWQQLALLRDPRVRVVDGGAARSDSVRCGLQTLREELADDAWILVHDAARPCVRSDELAALIDQVREDAVGGLLAVPIVDTIKHADATGRASETVDRTGLWRALTPQMFRYAILCSALDHAARSGVAVTDEAQAVELLGLRPKLVSGSADNLKITVPEDLDRAARTLAMVENGRTSQ
jgi:2-C-methyl-D-erythritol 4-phosphate cytidylyltransferase